MACAVSYNKGRFFCCASCCYSINQYTMKNPVVMTLVNKMIGMLVLVIKWLNASLTQYKVDCHLSQHD